MLNLVKALLLVAPLSFLSLNEAEAHDRWSDYYEEYHVIYPSSGYIIVIDSLRHSHNGGPVHSHYHRDRYHEHKKRVRFKKIYKKHYKKKVKKGMIYTKKPHHHHH